MGPVTRTVPSDRLLGLLQVYYHLIDYGSYKISVQTDSLKAYVEYHLIDYGTSHVH